MLSQKELLQVEDFLGMEQSAIKSFGHLANTVQDNQVKQLLQQIVQKNQQHFQTINKHLQAGQSLQ